MSKKLFVDTVLERLGYTNHPPHHVQRQIESGFLQQMTVDEVVKAVTELNARPA